MILGHAWKGSSSNLRSSLCFIRSCPLLHCKFSFSFIFLGLSKPRSRAYHHWPNKIVALAMTNMTCEFINGLEFQRFQHWSGRLYPRRFAKIRKEICVFGAGARRVPPIVIAFWMERIQKKCWRPRGPEATKKKTTEL